VLASTACFDPLRPADEDPTGEAGSDDGSTGAAEPSGPTDAGTVADATTAGSESGGVDDDEEIDVFDSFDADLGAWSFHDDVAALVAGPGDWQYEEGDLLQRADISGPEQEVPSAGTYAFGGDPDWDAYTVTVAFTPDDDGVVGVVCHATSPLALVRFELDLETGVARLVRSVEGQASVLAESDVLPPAAIALGVPHTLSVACGGSYRGAVDETLVLDTVGDPSAEGAVGMYASSIGDGPDGLRFHWIEVSSG
jgi:hypothetical protein